MYEIYKFHSHPKVAPRSKSFSWVPFVSASTGWLLIVWSKVDLLYFHPSTMWFAYFLLAYGIWIGKLKGFPGFKREVLADMKDAEEIQASWDQIKSLGRNKK